MIKVQIGPEKIADGMRVTSPVQNLIIHRHHAARRLKKGTFDTW